MMHRRLPSNFTYVSSCVKYMIFFLNFVFWLVGGLFISVGLWSFFEKWQHDWASPVDSVYDVILNISLVVLITGFVVLIISFAGCLGALRENNCLLKFYSLCLLFFFLMEMGIAITGFVFPQNMNTFLEESFTERIIVNYRDDADLQNLIDFAQQEFKCCGLSSAGYLDWGKNEYFNCSSPSAQSCGVPYSCCINATASGILNTMCGHGTQNSSVAKNIKNIYTNGCVDIVRVWAERNLYTIAGIALIAALVQLLVIYLAKTLEGQIELQRSRWSQS